VRSMSARAIFKRFFRPRYGRWFIRLRLSSGEPRAFAEGLFWIKSWWPGASSSEVYLMEKSCYPDRPRRLAAELAAVMKITPFRVLRWADLPEHPPAAATPAPAKTP
jgi:hypothetical protein